MTLGWANVNGEIKEERRWETLSYDLIINRGKVVVVPPNNGVNPVELIAPDGTTLNFPADTAKVTTPALDTSGVPSSIEVAPFSSGTVGPTEMQWTAGGGGWVDPNAPPPGGGGDEPPLIQ
jgi:hypothetical protein